MQDEKKRMNDKMVDRGWRQMEALLDRELPVKRRRKAFLWLWLCLGLLLIAGFFYMGMRDSSAGITRNVSIAELEESRSESQEKSQIDDRVTVKSDNASIAESSAHENKMETVSSDLSSQPVERNQRTNATSPSDLVELKNESVVYAEASSVMDNEDMKGVAEIRDANTAPSDRNRSFAEVLDRGVFPTKRSSSPERLVMDVGKLKTIYNGQLESNDFYGEFVDRHMYGQSLAMISCPMYIPAKFQYGIFASTLSDNLSTYGGVKGGLFAEFNLGKRWSVQTRVSYSAQKKNGFNNVLGFESFNPDRAGDVLNESFPVENLAQEEIYFIVDRTSYLGIELSLNKAIYKGLYARVGGGLSYLQSVTNIDYDRKGAGIFVTGDFKVASPSYVQEELRLDLNRTDYYGSFGLGYSFGRFSLEANYNHGFRNLIEFAPISEYNLSEIPVDRRDLNRSFELGILARF